MKKTMKRTKWWLPALILLTAFQLISMAQVVFNDDGSLSTECLIFFGAYLAVEWVYFIAMSIASRPGARNDSVLPDGYRARHRCGRE